MGQRVAPAERARLAIAYLKAEVPQDDPVSAEHLIDDDAPVLEPFADGLLRMYLVDEGGMFSYVQRRDLRAAGIDADELHRIGLENLRKRAARVEVRRVHPEVTA